MANCICASNLPTPFLGKTDHRDGHVIQESPIGGLFGIILISSHLEKTFFLCGSVAKLSVAMFLSPRGSLSTVGGNKIGEHVKTS